MFRKVKWLTVKAYSALGDCIAASPGQVLAQLQKQGEPRVFFGALVIWVHKSTTRGPCVSCALMCDFDREGDAKAHIEGGDRPAATAEIAVARGGAAVCCTAGARGAAAGAA